MVEDAGSATAPPTHGCMAAHGALTPAELKILEGLSWSKRMTKGRALQQRLAGTTL